MDIVIGEKINSLQQIIESTVCYSKLNSSSNVNTSSNCLPLFNNHGKLLIIDNDAINNRVFNLYLKNTKFKVTHSLDISEIKKMIGSYDIDLIFLDYHLDSLKVTDLLRELEQEIPPQLICPIIALTGDTSDHTKQQIINSGFSEVLYKPYCQDQLLKAVTHWSRTTVVDWKHLLNLHELVDKNNQFIYDLVDIIETESQKGIQILKKHSSQDEILKVIHTLKNTSSTMGANSLLKSVCSILSEKEQNNNIEISPDTISLLVNTWEQTIYEVKNKCSLFFGVAQ